MRFTRSRGPDVGRAARMLEGFRTLMHATRSAFDSLSMRIAAGAPPDTVVGRMVSITNNLACHAAYRLEALP